MSGAPRAFSSRSGYRLSGSKTRPNKDLEPNFGSTKIEKALGGAALNDIKPTSSNERGKKEQEQRKFRAPPGCKENAL